MREFLGLCVVKRVIVSGKNLQLFHCGPLEMSNTVAVMTAFKINFAVVARMTLNVRPCVIIVNFFKGFVFVCKIFRHSTSN